MADISHVTNVKSADYQIGDYDRRPWGFWLVTNVPASGSADFCEKVIVVAPKQILSLQSHNLRHETWSVLDGSLVTLIDGVCTTLVSGQEIEVPTGAPHTMANLGDLPCIIKERQIGTCRESDIVRYLDAYGRITAGTNQRIMKTVELYYGLLEQATGKQQLYA